MSTHATLDPDTAALLREAAAWRVLARLFECPDDHWRAEIASLTRELYEDDLQSAVAAIDDSATPGLYYSVFGPGGPAPPREASYHEAVELGSLVTDLAGYYEAFSYAPRTSEPLDHVAVEISFLSYLKFKEAYARVQGHADRADVAHAAAVRFVADHLSRIAAPLADLLSTSGVPYLAEASRVLVARVGARPGPMRLPMARPGSGDEDEQFPCGLP
jgi:TorA maturation chaperone TorD